MKFKDKTPAQELPELLRQCNYFKTIFIPSENMVHVIPVVTKASEDDPDLVNVHKQIGNAKIPCEITFDSTKELWSDKIKSVEFIWEIA